MTGPARIRRVNQDFAWIGWRTVGTGMKWRRVLLGLLGGFKVEFAYICINPIRFFIRFSMYVKVDLRLTLWEIGHNWQFQDGDGFALHFWPGLHFSGGYADHCRQRMCLESGAVGLGGPTKWGAKIIRNWWLFKMGKPEAFQQDQPITSPREMTWTTQSFTAVRCCGRFSFPSPRVSDDGGWHPRRRKLGSPLRLDSLLDASWIESGRCSTLISAQHVSTLTQGVRCRFLPTLMLSRGSGIDLWLLAALMHPWQQVDAAICASGGQ